MGRGRAQPLTTVHYGSVCPKGECWASHCGTKTRNTAQRSGNSAKREKGRKFPRCPGNALYNFFDECVGLPARPPRLDIFSSAEECFL
jgi:hypothetical protein